MVGGFIVVTRVFPEAYSTGFSPRHGSSSLFSLDYLHIGTSFDWPFAVS